LFRYRRGFLSFGRWKGDYGNGGNYGWKELALNWNDEAGDCGVDGPVGRLGGDEDGLGQNRGTRTAE
jgi:hypothetical protein